MSKKSEKRECMWFVCVWRKRVDVGDGVSEIMIRLSGEKMGCLKLMEWMSRDVEMLLSLFG